MKPESRPSSEQGLANAVNLAGPLITSSSRETPGKARLFKRVSCSRSVLALHLNRLFDNAGLPTRRETALRAVTKEVVGIHVLLTRSLSGGGIPRRLLLRVSLAKPTSAPLRF